jgi:ABC-2 type transport system ATP-binding protein
MGPAIQISGLTKTFGRQVVAVNALDLQVQRGTVYGLIGRNGAGKTTTLRLLMGLLKPSSGTALLLGQDFWRASAQVREQVGYVSQQLHLPEWMSLAELNRYCSHFYAAWDADWARQLARRWDLPWERPLGQLSTGGQRLAALIGALAARPELLLLDEPGAGLDAISRHSMLSCLAEALQDGRPSTILLSTHQLSDLERLATQVGIMDHGRMLMEGTVDDWQATMRRVQVVFEGDSVPESFSIPGALRSTILGPVITGVVRMVDEAQLDGLRQLPNARVFVFPLNLEELFVELLQPHCINQSFGQPADSRSGDPLRCVGQQSPGHAAPAERERDV